MLIPPPLVPVSKCKRCGLLYKKKAGHCTHCQDLPDTEVEELKLRYKKYQKGNFALGVKFLLAAFVLTALSIIIFQHQ